MPVPSSDTRISRRPPSSMTISIGARAGVERVLDEFLDDRRRPLDHLAGGDAVDQDGIEAADGRVAGHERGVYHESRAARHRRAGPAARMVRRFVPEMFLRSIGDYGFYEPRGIV